MFISGARLLLPAAIIAPRRPPVGGFSPRLPPGRSSSPSAPAFAWGFGAILFGQSSAIGISLANTFMLAVSSAFSSLIPMLALTRQKLHEHAGHTLLLGISIEIAGIVLCGFAGMIRERAGASTRDRGNLVGKARPLAIALRLVCGSGVLSAVFNIGFVLSAPIATFGQTNGLTQFQGTNLIWVLILGGGAVSNLGFCAYPLVTNLTVSGFSQPAGARLCSLGMLMALLWGGSIFVYGAAGPNSARSAHPLAGLSRSPPGFWSPTPWASAWASGDTLRASPTRGCTQGSPSF